MSAVDSLVKETAELLTREGAGPREWGQSISLLQDLRKTGVTSAEVEANLGRAYFKLENFPKAVEHFELAVRLDRWNMAYRNDLSLAQAKVSGALGESMEHPAEWGHTLASFIRPQELLFFASLLLFALLAWKYLARHVNRMGWYLGLITSIVLGGLGFFAQSASSIALVTSLTPVSVRSAPIESSEEIILIQPGSRLRVLKESGDFVEVERPNAFRGWAPKDSVKSLQNL